MSYYPRNEVGNFGNTIVLDGSQNRLILSEPRRTWHERDSVIYLTVKSNGMTGRQWINCLERKGYNLKNGVEKVLCSPSFKPTRGVTTHMSVFKGILFTDEERITKNICAIENNKKYIKPNIETVCLIREKFSDKDIEEMGLWWIIVMHEPVKDFKNESRLLGVGRGSNGSRIDAFSGCPEHNWARVNGFCFCHSNQ